MPKADIVSKKFILCPECKKKDWCIQHLIDTIIELKQIVPVAAGPWFCDCGYGFTLSIQVTGARFVIVNIETYKDRKYPEYALLEMVLDGTPLRLVVENARYKPAIDSDHMDYLKFKYGENANPANVFTSVVGVLDDLQVSFKLLGLGADPDELMLNPAESPEEPGTEN